MRPIRFSLIVSTRLKVFSAAGLPRFGDTPKALVSADEEFAIAGNDRGVAPFIKRIHGEKLELGTGSENEAVSALSYRVAFVTRE